MRLQRFLARAGVASRRGSERLMTEGRVRINGEVKREMGTKVDPLHDVVTVDGKRVHISAPVTIMLNKPAGYVTTMSDPHARKTIAELMPTTQYPGLFPIGRLDTDTTGLLLCTTDGNLAQHLLHPKHHVEKRYLMRIQGELTDADKSQLETGVDMGEGVRSAPAEVELAPEDGTSRYLKAPQTESTIVALRIHEGKKHQVKRMLEAVSHPVLKLHRTHFAGLELKDVESGAWRELSVKEYERLYQAAGLNNPLGE